MGGNEKRKWVGEFCGFRRRIFVDERRRIDLEFFFPFRTISSMNRLNFSPHLFPGSILFN